jgi:hypothetical protein
VAPKPLRQPADSAHLAAHRRYAHRARWYLGSSLFLTGMAGMYWQRLLLFIQQHKPVLLQGLWLIDPILITIWFLGFYYTLRSLLTGPNPFRPRRH